MNAQNKKIYTPAHIGFGTFLGSLLMGTYMMAHNYKVFGQLRQAWMVGIIGVFLFATLVGIALLTQEEHATSILPSMIAVGAYYLSRRIQGPSIEKHLAEGGLPYKWGPVVLFSVLVLAVIFVLLFCVIWAVVPL